MLLSCHRPDFIALQLQPELVTGFVLTICSNRLVHEDRRKSFCHLSLTCAARRIQLETSNAGIDDRNARRHKIRAGHKKTGSDLLKNTKRLSGCLAKPAQHGLTRNVDVKQKKSRVRYSSPQVDEWHICTR